MALTWCPQGSLSASGRGWRSGRGWLGVAALETAARWSKKRRSRSHRRGRLTTPRGVTERERRHNPGRRRREAPRHRSERAPSLPLECAELLLLGNGTHSGPTRNSKCEWQGLAFEPWGGYKTTTVTRKVQSYLVTCKRIPRSIARELKKEGAELTRPSFQLDPLEK